MNRRYKIFLIVMLAMFTAFAPLINNSLGPILGKVAAWFGADGAVANLGLTASMAGLAAGQLIIGPLSDKYGRRRPVLLSVLLFTVASVAITFAPSIGWFIGLRVLQGFGGAGGIVISRSIAADNFKGHELMTVIAVTGAINGIAPIVVPAASGAVVSLGGWQAVFAVLAAVGLLMLAGSWCLRESLPDGHRSGRSLLATYRLYAVVVRNRRFMLYVLHQCTAEFILFGNIASVAFMLPHYGYNSPAAPGVALSINGIFTALGAGLAARFRRAQTGVQTSCAGLLTLSVAQAAVLCLGGSFWLYEALICLMLLFLGFTLTASTTLVLESERRLAGTASALFGAMGFIAGAVVAPLTSLGNPVHSTALVFVAGAVLASLFAWAALRCKSNEAKAN